MSYSIQVLDASEVRETKRPLKEPSTKGFFLEARALGDLLQMPPKLIASYISKAKSVDSATSSQAKVMLFPGYGSDHRYMKPLAAFISNLGFDVTDWGLGFNFAGVNLEHSPQDLDGNWQLEFPEDYDFDNYVGEAGVAHLIDLATKKAADYHADDKRPLVLIGWSLGGYIAREVARNLEDKIDQVITMGSPVIGGPKYTKGAVIYRRKGFDLDWIEREVDKRNQQPLKLPITAIFSKSDKVVEWRSTIDKINPQVEHIEIDCAHLGMGFNPKIWSIVKQKLEPLR